MAKETVIAVVHRKRTNAPNVKNTGPVTNAVRVMPEIHSDLVGFQ
jgi:hypothetical protein